MFTGIFTPSAPWGHLPQAPLAPPTPEQQAAHDAVYAQLLDHSWTCRADSCEECRAFLRAMREALR